MVNSNTNYPIHNHILDLNKDYIKILFVGLYVCGWLFPKLSIGGVSFGIQDLACILLLMRFKINKQYAKIFFADIFYSIVLLFYSIIEFLNYHSLDGLLISVRVFLFVVAGIAILRYDKLLIERCLKLIMKVYMVYFLYNFSVIIFSVLSGSVNLIMFLRGYGDFRIKAPFEGGGTTTVPIGYMFSLLLTATLALYGKWVNFFISLCALGTASRAAIVSVFLTHGIKINFKKFSSWLLAVPFVFLFLGFIVLKSYSSDSGDIDGSSSKRLDLYTYAIDLMYHNPSALVMGFGVSPKTLDLAIGETFFESMIFNSLIQGGLLLCLSCIFILVKSIYYDYYYKLNYICIPILIGNIIGGSNYFSMFAFPLMVVLIIHTIQYSKYAPNKDSND